MIAADVVGRGHDPGLHVGLLDPVDRRRGRAGGWDSPAAASRRRSVYTWYSTVGHRGDEVEVELALQPLLHDLHVQQAEEAAAEPEAERGGRLRLVLQAGVVEPELLQGVAQVLVLVGLGRIEPREHHRLDLPVARQQLGRPVVSVEDGVAHPGVAHVAEARHQVARPRPPRAAAPAAGPAGGSPPRPRGTRRPGGRRTRSPSPGAPRRPPPGCSGWRPR